MGWTDCPPHKTWCSRSQEGICRSIACALRVFRRPVCSVGVVLPVRSIGLTSAVAKPPEIVACVVSPHTYCMCAITTHPLSNKYCLSCFLHPEPRLFFTVVPLCSMRCCVWKAKNEGYVCICGVDLAKPKPHTSTSMPKYVWGSVCVVYHTIQSVTWPCGAPVVQLYQHVVRSQCRKGSSSRENRTRCRIDCVHLGVVMVGICVEPSLENIVSSRRVPVWYTDAETALPFSSESLAC